MTKPKQTPEELVEAAALKAQRERKHVAWTSPISKKASLQLRRIMTMELIVQGFSYRQVAEQLGVGASTVKDDYDNEIKAIRAEVAQDVSHHKEVQLAQINRLLQTWFQRAVGYMNQARVSVPPSATAAQIVMSALRLKAQLLDLNAPIKISNPDGTNLGFAVVREARPLADMSDEDLKRLTTAAALAEADEIIKKGAQP